MKCCRNWRFESELILGKDEDSLNLMYASMKIQNGNIQTIDQVQWLITAPQKSVKVPI